MLTKKDALAKYGKIPLKFSSYYKYTFTYTANGPDGESITGSYGGDSDDIYRHKVTIESTMDLENCYSVAIMNGEEKIASWHE